MEMLTAEDDGDDEEGSSQVTPEGHGPVEQHFVPGQLAVESGDGGVLYRLGTSQSTSVDKHTRKEPAQRSAPVKIIIDKP